MHQRRYWIELDATDSWSQPAFNETSDDGGYGGGCKCLFYYSPDGFGFGLFYVTGLRTCDVILSYLHDRDTMLWGFGVSSTPVRVG